MPTDDTSAPAPAHGQQIPRRTAPRRQRPDPRWHHAIMVASALCLGGPAWADNSGGSTDTGCGFVGDSYIGACSTDSTPATGGDVRIDTPPPSDDDPDVPVFEVVGGVNDGDGDATGNRVTVTGSATYDGTNLVGGFAACGGNATSNTVSIGGQAVLVNTANVVGGDSCSGAAEGNTVTIRDQAVVDGGIIMGGSGGTTATGNTIVLRDQATVGNGSFIVGGYALGDATGNAVVLRDQAAVDSSLIYGGYSTLGKAAGNTATIGDHATVLNGSLIYGGASAIGEASGNTVSIQGQAAISDAMAIAGGSTNTTAFGNTVIIRDQARVEDSQISGGESNDTGNATGNTVIIRDQARVENSQVFGGLATDGDATGNRIILQGTPSLAGTMLAGGVSGTGDDTTGNVLEIRGTGLVAGAIMNFDHYQYVLPAGTVPGVPVLTTDVTCMCDATVSVDAERGAGPFQPGTRITLMHSDDLDSERYSDTPTYITGRQGLALSYRWGLTATPTDLIATVDEVRVNEESKAPIEGRIAPMALISQAGDMIAGAAMDQARAAANAGAWTGFGALGGGRSRYDSGSHVDVDGLSFVLGAARRFDTRYGSLSAGAFVELGTGHYDSYNRFNSGTARGSGKTRYYGAGLMARQDFADPAAADARGPLGPYAEASLRAGRASSDWRSADLTRMLGTNASYDSAAPYYGAHLGLGYVAGLGARTSLDLYAKYFWNHQDGDRVSIAGDDFRFSDTDSHRVRAGARVGYAFGEQARAYAGAAWEHEFDGDARATVYGFEAPGPSLKGDTGVFELGLEIAPKEARALTVSLGVQAYTGKREGLGGSALLKYAF